MSHSTEHHDGSQPSPTHNDQGYLDPNGYPRTIPFGALNQSALPHPTGDPAMYPPWGPTTYAHPHGMPQAQAQYVQHHGAPYATHPGAQPGHPQFMPHPPSGQPYAPPPGQSYSQSPGQPYAPSPGQQPYPVAMNHQGQMYPYPYQLHHDQQVHQHMQPAQHHMQPEHHPNLPQAEIKIQDDSASITRMATEPRDGANPLSKAPTVAQDDSNLSNEEKVVVATQRQAALLGVGALMMNNGAGQDANKHQPTQGDSPKEIVAKEDIYNFALQLLSSKRKKASVPDPVKEKEQVPADARLHPYFAARAKAPDHLSYKIALVQPHTFGGLHDQVYTQYTPSCHCRRPVSRGMKATSEETHTCLKLYCECFAYGALCTERCACSSACFNNAAHSVERSRAVGAILQEDPNGFRRDMDWMTELQRTSRSEYLLPKEKKVVPKINTLDHEAITDDSLRLAKGRTHKRRKKKKVPPLYPTSNERIGYPELELLVDMEVRNVEEIMKKALAQVDEAAAANIEANGQGQFTVDKILAVGVVQELAKARKSAVAVREYVSAKYFEGPKLKREAVESLGFSVGAGSEKSHAPSEESELNGLRCRESLPEPKAMVQDQRMKDLILSAAEDTAIIQDTTTAIRGLARRIARRRFH